MTADRGWRRARSVLWRLLRVIAWPAAWPLWKLGMAMIRRDPAMAAAFHHKGAVKNARVLGPYHRATLRAQADHAVALSELGELEQAEAEMTEVIIRLDPHADDDARLLLHVRRWHHHVLSRLGWVSETEADARFLAEWYARHLGPDHPDTLEWRELIVVALWNARRRDEATAEMADVAARRAATQGASHPDTRQAERKVSDMTSNPDAVSFGLKPSTE